MTIWSQNKLLTRRTCLTLAASLMLGTGRSDVGQKS